MAGQDLSGRPHLSFDLQIPTERIGKYETQLVEHFFQSVVNTSGMTLHIRCAAFLHLIMCLRRACMYKPRDTTKAQATPP